MPSRSVRQAVQRIRLSKVELFPSALHGYKLLRLEPKVTSSLFHFLETTLKNRPMEWEPKYNLTPVTFTGSQFVSNDRQPENAKNAPAQEKKAQEPAKAKAGRGEPKQPAKNAPPEAPKPEPVDNAE